MGMRTIEKTVDVDAPRERVWSVLLDDATYRQWTAGFMDGSYADTDWCEGSTVRFLDSEGSGVLGRVVTHENAALLDVEMLGLVSGGTDDTESDDALAMRGSRETYRLTDVGSRTRLAISSDMDDAYAEGMSAAWDRGLATLKALAEG